VYVNEKFHYSLPNISRGMIMSWGWGGEHVAQTGATQNTAYVLGAQAALSLARLDIHSLVHALETPETFWILKATVRMT
jgi:alpha-D-ribose 1-methylphosphonate 5-phosphate C-P lyase